MPNPYPEPIEDIETRAPEWEAVQPGYGQPPLMRDIKWDPVHDSIESTGPVIAVKPPVKPA